MVRGNLQAQASTKRHLTKVARGTLRAQISTKRHLTKSGPRDSTSSDFDKTSLNKKWPAGLYELTFLQNVNLTKSGPRDSTR